MLTAGAHPTVSRLVYLAARSESRVHDAISSIQESIPKADLHFLLLDLQSLKSVRAAAEDFKKRESRLDLLINNAVSDMSCFSLFLFLDETPVRMACFRSDPEI